MIIKGYVNEGATKRKLICISECSICGDDKTISYMALARAGHTTCRSCINRTRTLKKRSVSKHPAFTRLKDMKARCYNKNNVRYENYGGRGIVICNEWLNDTRAFLKWADENGFKKELSIDRINNDGNYEPSNCKWSNRFEQQQNKSISRQNKTGYRGVSMYNGKFSVNLRNNRKYHHVGYYSTAIEAAKAFNAYVVANGFNNTLNEMP